MRHAQMSMANSRKAALDKESQRFRRAQRQIFAHDLQP
jgi:hypothetical protein